MAKSQETASVQTDGKDVKELQKKVKELEAQLLAAEVKAEVYDKMIEVAEARFGIPTRKKSGAKQWSTCTQRTTDAAKSGHFAACLA